MLTWAITVIAIVVFLWTIPHQLYWGRPHRRAKKLLKSRDELAPKQWLEATVATDQLEDAVEILERLAKALRVNPSKLRPTDRFYVELQGIAANPDGTSDDLDETFMDECDRFGVDQSLGEHVSTLADYIRLFATRGSNHTVCVVPCEPTRADHSS